MPASLTKRALPTVTLDQIFEALKENGACWYKELGPIRLAAKLENFFAGTSGPVSLRDVLRIHHKGEITAAEVLWLVAALGTRIKPAEITLTLNAAFSEQIAVLCEWENPKPPAPKHTLASIKPGTRFQFYRSPGYVAPFEFIKLGGCGWPELKEKAGTLHGCLQNGSLSWSSAPDTEVYLIEPKKA